jgi:NAD(P)H-nitrite reductase large subunit
MTIRKHLIIGCGSAALSALEIIRRITSEDEVKLVTMDDFPPYSPASLPYLLSGGITEAELWMKDKNYAKNLETTLVMGKEVVEVIQEKQKVIYQDGSSDYYDTLLVASGSEPDNPTIEGLQDVGFHSFRTLADCRCLMRQLEGKENVVILGAGMVGIKIALALIERGCQVSVIERKDSILPEYFDEEAELYIRETLVEHKARFFTSSDVE